MITYESGRWGLAFACSIKGSVIPKAVLWSVGSSATAATFSVLRTFVTHSEPKVPEGASFFIGYYFVSLAFLLVFRTQVAYKRFWDGAEALLRVRALWYNSFSALVAFSSRDDSIAKDVHSFKHLLVRLVSILYCEALKRASGSEGRSFESLGNEGIDDAHRLYLLASSDQCEVVLQWIQQAIVDGQRTGVLPIPPPILSSVFQDLSRGIVELQQVRTISDVPFPFPFAQTLTIMLLVTTALLAIMSGLTMTNPGIAAASAFAIPFAFWSINYTAQELEMPFGDDANDLNMEAMLQGFNRSLLTLLDVEAASAPRFELQPNVHAFWAPPCVTKQQTSTLDITPASTGIGMPQHQESNSVQNHEPAPFLETRSSTQPLHDQRWGPPLAFTPPTNASPSSTLASGDPICVCATSPASVATIVHTPKTLVPSSLPASPSPLSACIPEYDSSASMVHSRSSSKVAAAGWQESAELWDTIGERCVAVEMVTVDMKAGLQPRGASSKRRASKSSRRGSGLGLGSAVPGAHGLPRGSRETWQLPPADGSSLHTPPAAEGSFLAATATPSRVGSRIYGVPDGAREPSLWPRAQEELPPTPTWHVDLGCSPTATDSQGSPSLHANDISQASPGEEREELSMSPPVPRALFTE